MVSSLQSRAKLNLSLHITGRRADGYHLLESIVAFADAGDVITVRESRALTLSVTGEFASQLTQDENNLVLRAARMLAPNKTAHLTLEKNLPIASGIGGGSGDAAATLKLLNDFWDLQLSAHALHEVALKLGADVPMCLQNSSALVRGIGESIAPITLPQWHVVMVNPGIAISTKEIFADFAANGHVDLPSAFSGNMDWLSYLKSAQNSLQPYAIAHAPIIQTLLSALEDTKECLLARMSGSGATCFGLYETKAVSEAAKSQLQSIFPDFWLKTAILAG